MIITRGCIANYEKGHDPASKINAYLKEDPQARILDVKTAPIHYSDHVYVLLILDVPDDFDEQKKV